MKQTRLLSLMAALAIMLTTIFVLSCNKADEDVSDDGSTFMEVQGVTDTWVDADDIMDDDLQLLTDLSVKIEYMRLEFIRMLSNDFQNDKLFCGTGPKSNPDPAVETFTQLMANKDKYLAAIDRIESSTLMTPTTRSNSGNLKVIFNTGDEEGQAELERIQDNLSKLAKVGLYDEKTQEDLYNFYKQQEPRKASAIGAKDARDFFLMLNNGELNAYTVNISHIWRDKGILDEDKRTQDYAAVAFTGNAEYLKSAYRVSSKVAVATGEIYLSGIDKLMAGGMGSKLIELGDVLKDKLEMLRLAKQMLKGKPEWQSMNTYIVKQIMGDIKSAISDVMGDDGGISVDMINDIAENIADEITEQLTVEETEKTDTGVEEGRRHVHEMAKDGGKAAVEISIGLDIYTKLVIITDDRTGMPVIGSPNDQNELVVVTTPGPKTITVISSHGKRLTKKFTAEEGYNLVFINDDQKPFVKIPSTVTIDTKGGDETTLVLTNCKYLKYRLPEEQDWFSVSLTYNKNLGSMVLKISANANDTGNKRSGTVIIEGYNEKSSTGKPAATCNFRFMQKGEDVTSTELNFLTGGGTKIVTIDAKDYQHIGFDAPPSWLAVNVGSGNTLEITAMPNMTGKERTATVKCYASNSEKPKDEEKVYHLIKVTQQATAPTVNPTSLTFESEGGMQTLKINREGFNYTNVIIDEADKSWLSQKHNDGVYEMTAEPNTKNQERSTIIRCYATNAQKGTDDETFFMDVKVTQKAGEELTGLDKYQFAYGFVEMTIYTDIDGNNTMGRIDFEATDKFLTVSSNGKGLHFDINYKVNETNYSESVQCQFDIDDLSLLENKKSNVTNLSWKVDTNNKGGRSWAGVWAGGGDGWLVSQTQKIRFSTNSKIPEMDFEWGDDGTRSVNWYAYDNDISPSECSYDRSSTTISEEVGVVIDKGKGMQDGSNIWISLHFKEVAN